MDFLDLAQSRFSVREFKSNAVESAKLQPIIDAARVAPTGCNKQPFHIYVIQSPEALAKIRQCTVCHFDAPVVFLICTKAAEAWVRPFDGKNIAEIDASIVCTHMMLAAASVGLGSTWVAYFEPDKVISQFNLPKDQVPLALLPVGYPADNAQPNPMHGSRAPVEDIITFL